MPRPTKLAKLAIEALEDLKGVDIKVIDVQKLTPITDTMIVCTGTSNRHVKSLAGSVIEKAKHAGFQPSGVEGMEMGEWVLVNLGGVIVHVMQLQSRAFYQLEKLWDLPPPDEPAAPRRAKPKTSSKSATKSAGKGGGKSSKSAKSAKSAKGTKSAKGGKATGKASAKRLGTVPRGGKSKPAAARKPRKK